jgi:periplasmic protein TonB
VAKTSLVYGVSLLVHGALALGVIALGVEQHRETIAISVSEAKKKPPEPSKVVEDPKPPEPKTEAPKQAKARAVAAPRADAPVPEAAAPTHTQGFEGLPDLGLAMGNGGPGGMAIPQGGPIAAAPATSAHAPPAPKVLGPKPVDECTDPPVKPKRKLVSTPPYPAAAREAGVEGLVRVEVTVGVDGSVTGARILAGLGHGLDEAALEAARRASFEPAMRCGKPVVGTAVLPFRFKQ